MTSVRRSVVLTAALCAVLLLGGCEDQGGSTADGNGGVPARGQPAPQIPSVLVGDWSGGGTDGFRSSVWSFRPDGSYRQNIGGGVLTGRFTVRGSRLAMYPEGGGAPLTFQWAVTQDGHILYLDGESYVRFT
ncbi:hypothetical protein ACFV7Q_01790 [Streptomyces sp. NPDC059851]|uniref:hypothetical protein n=1 Tax=Streptomyces sp. NPDC059851 TaxID=3346971 RepID=UPI003653E631